MGPESVGCNPIRPARRERTGECLPSSAAIIQFISTVTRTHS